MGIGGAYIGVASADPNDSGKKLEQYEQKKQAALEDAQKKQAALEEASAKLAKAKSGQKYNQNQIANVEKQIEELEVKIEQAQDDYYKARADVLRASRNNQMIDPSTSNNKLKELENLKKNLDQKNKNLKAYRSNLEMHNKNIYELDKKIKGEYLNVPYYGGTVRRIGGLSSDVEKSQKSLEQLELEFQSEVHNLKSDILLANLNNLKIRLGNNQEKLDAEIKKYDELIDIDNTYIGNYVARKTNELKSEICSIVNRCGIEKNITNAVNTSVNKLSNEIKAIEEKIKQSEADKSEQGN